MPMEWQVQDTWVCVEELLGWVAMVNVPVEDKYPLQVQLVKQQLGCYGDRVEIAKTPERKQEPSIRIHCRWWHTWVNRINWLIHSEYFDSAPIDVYSEALPYTASANRTVSPETIMKTKLSWTVPQVNMRELRWVSCVSDFIPYSTHLLPVLYLSLAVYSESIY